MKIKVEERKILEEGKHEGAIIAVEYREKPYKYVDFVIETTENEATFKLKAGYAQYLRVDTQLGLLFKRFGYNLKVGQNVEPEELIGKKVQFLTVTKNRYANILPATLKPIDN